MSLITLVTKEQLLHIVATHEPEQPFNLDVVMNEKRDENITLGI